MTSGLPSVAVLLSTYNGEAFLQAQLESLALQQGVAVQVFVRDDGSSDGTLAVLRSFAHLWPQLAAPFTGANLKPAMSFLELLRSAPEGFDYYAFCDQDDVWLPDKLSRAAASLQDMPPSKPTLYCSLVTCVDRDLHPLGPPRIDRDGRFKHLLFENIAYGNTVVMNTEARRLISSRKPLRGVIMHDWWCALTVSAFGAVHYDERSGVLYRQHGRNMVGASQSRVAEVGRLVAALWRDRRQFWPVHAQAAEFLRLYGDQLASDRRRLVQDLVTSRRSLPARIRFAISGHMTRSNFLGAVAGRALVVAGWY